MNVITVKKGFDIPISGEAEQRVRQSVSCTQVALCPPDFPGFLPKLLVKEGDSVSIGSPVLEDKKRPAIRLCSPGGGKVHSIVRGARRKLEELVIEIEEDNERSESFQSWESSALSGLESKQIIEHLLATGLWPLFKQRPYGKIADPEARPRSVYVSGMDTEPLAADQEFLLTGREEFFRAGMEVIKKLTEGKTYLCVSGHSNFSSFTEANGVEVRKFIGPHPSGLTSTHIQYTEPYRKGDIIWNLRAIDAAVIGELFLTGVLNTERLVAVAGPGSKNPCYVKTRLGSKISSIAGAVTEDPVRYVSGSILSGQEVAPEGFMGFYSTTLTILANNQERLFMGWVAPQWDTFSWTRLFPGHFKKKLFPMSTMLHSTPRAILPIGFHEEMTPLDIYPTFLIKAILAGELEEAEELGLLECTEEDMALITHVDPSKLNYGEILREALDRHEKEG